jgi:hypothetical protein
VEIRHELVGLGKETRYLFALEVRHLHFAGLSVLLWPSFFVTPFDSSPSNLSLQRGG